MGPQGRTKSGRHALRRLLAFTAWASLASCAAVAGRRAGPEGEESTADKHYKIAVGSFHNGLMADAKIQVDRALRVTPSHADSHYLRGLILLQEAKSIVDAVESTQCLRDEAADHQRERAEALYREARASFEAAARHHEERAAGRGRAFNSMAVVALIFHDYDEAIAKGQKALETEFYADRYSALANLGWAYREKGDLVQAMTELRQSVLLNPDYCVGRYRLAQVYLDAGMVSEALEEAAVVTQDERCPIQDAHRIVGAARQQLGQIEEAGAAYASCVEISPRSCLARDCQKMARTVSPGVTEAALAGR